MKLFKKKERCYACGQKISYNMENEKKRIRLETFLENNLPIELITNGLVCYACKKYKKVKS